MQATFELSGEILERLRQESARSGRPQSALVEAALQTALPAPPAGDGDAAAGDAPALDAPSAGASPSANATPDAAQSRPPLNLPSWDLGQPTVDVSNRDELYRDLDDERYKGFFRPSEKTGEESPAAAPDANAAPDAAAETQPRPPLNLPSWDLEQLLADLSNRDESYRILDDERYWKFAQTPEPANEEAAPDTPDATASPPPMDAAAQPRPPLNLPSWSCGKPFVDVNNRDELYQALDDDAYFEELYGFRLNPDAEAQE